MEMSFFSDRRLRFMEEMKPSSIALIPAATPQLRDGDTFYPFHQNSDFYYLTGYPESSALAVMLPGKGKDGKGQFILFNQKKDEKAERWTGPLIGQEGARALYGADEAYAIEELDKRIPELISGCQTLYYPVGVSECFERQVNGWVQALGKQARSGVNPPAERIALGSVLHELRLIKVSQEISCIREAVRISMDAHTRAMQMCKPGLFEFSIQAELMHEFISAGCRHVAYDPIVASGANACVLHHTQNESLLKAGELLLVDAGVECTCGYASDITRTYPIDGKFSGEQKALYEIVLEAQTKAISAVKPGNGWNHPHEEAVRVLTQGLVDLKLLKGDVSNLIEQKSYLRFYPHQTGHWLGLNVHDVGTYKVNDAWRILKPGMTLTVEPGLYIVPATDVEEKWWNIGIRIEDDVLVTEGGCDVLSQDLPKTVEEIEKLMRA